MTTRQPCPKTTWRNYFESEALAGGDFCTQVWLEAVFKWLIISLLR